jgi:hypothetical protein
MQRRSSPEREEIISDTGVGVVSKSGKERGGTSFLGRYAYTGS